MCVWPEEVIFGTSYKVTIRPKIGVFFVGWEWGGAKFIYTPGNFNIVFRLFCNEMAYDWKLLYAIVISQAREQ